MLIANPAKLELINAKNVSPLISAGVKMAPANFYNRIQYQ